MAYTVQDKDITLLPLLLSIYLIFATHLTPNLRTALVDHFRKDKLVLPFQSDATGSGGSLVVSFRARTSFVGQWIDAAAGQAHAVVGSSPLDFEHIGTGFVHSIVAGPEGTYSNIGKGQRYSDVLSISTAASASSRTKKAQI
jgi:hypothetical protein